MAAPRRGIEAVVVDPVEFGGYWLLDPIAEGRLGTVHRALRRRDGVPDEMLAIKRVSPALLRDRRFAERFIDVMAHVAKLRHPAHCTIEDIDLTRDGSLYAASEWVPGRDLGRITAELNARGEAMPPHLVAYIGAEVATALAAAHGLSVSGTPTPLYHGELAPPDILVGYDGRVKMTGLESAALQAALRSPTPRIAYQAPELALGDPYSARGDIYSLGACLYELLTGRPAASAAARAGAIAGRRPESHITKVIPRLLEPIIRRALADQPEARWDSAAELARALQKFLAAQPEQADAEALSAFMGRLFEHAQADDEVQLQQWLARIPVRESASRPPAPPSLPAAATPAPTSARPSYTQLVRANERPRRPSPPPSAAVQPEGSALPESGPIATDKPRSRPPSTPTVKPQSRPPATRPPVPARPVAEVFDDPAEKTPSKNNLMSELAAEMTDPQGDELRALAASSMPPRAPAEPDLEEQVSFDDEKTPAPLWESTEAAMDATWQAAAGAAPAAAIEVKAVQPEAHPEATRASRPSSPFGSALPSVSAVRSAQMRPAPASIAPTRKRPIVPVLAGAAALLVGLLGAMLFFRGTQGAPGSIQIETRPAGAEVSLNGERFGQSPLRLEGVKSGTATIDVRKAGYEPITRKVMVVEGQLFRLNLELASLDRTAPVAAPAAAPAAPEPSAPMAPAAEPSANDDVVPAVDVRTARRSHASEPRRPAVEEPAPPEPVLQVTESEPAPEPEVTTAAAPVIDTHAAPLRGGSRLLTQLPPRPAEAPAAPPAAPAAAPATAAAEPAAQAASRGAHRGVHRGAVLVERSDPRFPARAKRRGITEGTVTVEFTVDRSGTVADPKIIKAEPVEIFDEAVLRAVRDWKYQPKLEGSVPVPSRQRVTIKLIE